MTNLQQIKSQVKRLFREFYTYQTIKMVFPELDLRKKESWVQMLGKLADMLDDKVIAESTRKEQNQAAVNGLDYAMSKINIKLSKSKEDFIGVYSANLSYKDDEKGNWQKLGTVVFNHVSRLWSIGRNQAKYKDCTQMLLDQLQAIWDANEARKSLFAA